MSIISLIAAVDEANGLGFENKLLCHLPADLQHFKSISMGKPILMGRSTFESIGKPLPGRLNIVLSKTVSSISGVEVVDSLEKAITRAEEFPELMIIGGAILFNQTMTMADRIYLTRIHHQFQADVFFPEIDTSLWKCTQEQHRSLDEKNPYDMTFYTFDKKKN